MTSGIYEPSDRIPNSYVQSCSECSMAKAPDGGPNINGMLQKAMCTTIIDNIHGHMEILDCGKCPVHLSTHYRLATTAEGKKILWKHNHQQLTENELLKLQEDGDDILTFCYLT